MQAAPGLGSPLPAYAPGLTPAISVPGVGSPQPHLHRNPKADAGRSEMAIKELENEGGCKVDAKCYPKEVCAMCSCEYPSVAEYFKRTC